MQKRELIYKDSVLEKLNALASEPNYQHPGEDWGVGVCMADTIVYEEEPVSLKIERVSSDSGDWHGFYVNGTLVHEGHDIPLHKVVYGISRIIPLDYTETWIPDEVAENGLPSFREYPFE